MLLRFVTTSLAVSLLLSPASLLLAQNPLIVAHRGASFDAPENTLPAFELAWRQNADAIEGDFYLTRDGEIVCIHDKNTKRYARQNLVVAQSTFEELRKLDVGSYKDPKYRGTRIPSFLEVAATVPQGKKIYIEVKCGPEIIPVLDRQLKKTKLAEDQIVVISFNADVIKAFKKVRPGQKAYWLSSFKKRLLKVSPKVETVTQTLHEIQADGFSSSQKHLTREYVEAIRKQDFEHHVWTVNDPQQAVKLAAWKVGSITTDRPGLIRQSLDKALKK